MALLAAELVDCSRQFGALSPGLAQDLARQLTDGAGESIVFLERARPERKVELQSRPGGPLQSGPRLLTFGAAVPSQGLIEFGKAGCVRHRRLDRRRNR